MRGLVLQALLIARDAGLEERCTRPVDQPTRPDLSPDEAGHRVDHLQVGRHLERRRQSWQTRGKKTWAERLVTD